MSSAYELAREKRIAQNQAYLDSLGLSSAREAAQEELTRRKAERARKSKKRKRGT